MNILITGGAGYIGSHTVKAAVAVGHKVTVLDNFRYGHHEAIVDPEVVIVEGDIGDTCLLQELFGSNSFDVVIHFAAFAYVGESVTEPLKYYKNNVSAPVNLLLAMQEHGVSQFVFSSTCATYGNAEKIPISESSKQLPINPYGESKLILERILRDCESAWGLRSVFLRYFNAAGCSFEGDLGEDHDPETHLIPLVLQSLLKVERRITVFGTDYSTSDGTCIRDYIHVEDLAEGHLKAVQYLKGGGKTDAFNLGTGVGVSVQQIIESAERCSGLKAKVDIGSRRQGDPPELVADPAYAKKVLGWEAKHKSIDTIVASAWRWMLANPNGYSSKSIDSSQ